MRLVGILVVSALLVVAALVAWRVLGGSRRGLAGTGQGRLGSRRPPSGPSVVTVCLPCQGTGWIGRRERTLEFTGDGFADIEHPSTMCEACGGTGQRIR